MYKVCTKFSHAKRRLFSASQCFIKWRSCQYRAFSSKEAKTKRKIKVEPETKVRREDFNYNAVLSFEGAGTALTDVHTIWLRHHCQCPKCYNHETNQRVQIPSDLPGTRSTISSWAQENSHLIVQWSDGHESRFDLEWLKNHAPKKSSRRESQHWPSIYSSFLPEESPEAQVQEESEPEVEISYRDFMNDKNDDGVGHLLGSIVKHGYGIVNDCPVDFEETKTVISKVSHPQNTIYGDFSQWTSNLAHADTAYTSNHVHLHTDTTYFTEPIGLQIFHCLKHEGTGGVNHLADGFRIAKEIASQKRQSYLTLSSIPVPCHYVDSSAGVIKHHFLSHDVTIGHDRISGEIQKIRYNPHDMAVLRDLSFEDVAGFYESLVQFSDKLETDFRLIKLTPGLVIFLNNWRILHGRTAFTGFRHLCGAYISRSDWLSRARTLKLV